MRILAALAFVICCSAQAAAPSIVCTPTQTSGSAPLGVVLDCSGTMGGTKPFHNLQYTHTFGDSAAGTWSTGSRSGQSKNFAIGPIAAYVYETAGSYTISSMACNSGGECARTTNAITVSAANTVFNQAATKCFYQTTPSGDCPNGGTETQNADFDNALGGCVGATKRCLFQRGSTFTASTAVSITTATGLIGAYGSGALPVVNSTSATSVISFGASASDQRVMDLNIVGQGASDTSAAIVSEDTTPTKITILRITITNIGKGIIVTGLNYLNKTLIQDSTITQIQATSGGVGVFGRYVLSAIMGNTVGPFPTDGTHGEHNVRLQPAIKTVVSNNTLTTPGGSGKQVLTIRALEHVTEQPDADAQYVYISDNKMSGGATSIQIFEIGPASTSQDNWIYDVVAERNWIDFGSVAANGQFGQSVRLTMRNNLCVGTTGAANRVCFAATASNTAGAPDPDDNQYLNNTCYSGGSGATFDCVSLDGGVSAVTNSVVKNNLGYAPSATSPHLLITAGTVTGTSSGNNTGDSGSMTTDPVFTNVSSAPQGFAISTSSYADTGGTATGTYPAIISDFNNCWDKDGEARIGAFVPRSLAICVGAP